MQNYWLVTFIWKHSKPILSETRTQLLGAIQQMCGQPARIFTDEQRGDKTNS